MNGINLSFDQFNIQIKKIDYDTYLGTINLELLCTINSLRFEDRLHNKSLWFDLKEWEIFVQSINELDSKSLSQVILNDLSDEFHLQLSVGSIGFNVSVFFKSEVSNFRFKLELATKIDVECFGVLKRQFHDFNVNDSFD